LRKDEIGWSRRPLVLILLVALVICVGFLLGFYTAVKLVASSLDVSISSAALLKGGEEVPNPLIVRNVTIDLVGVEGSNPRLRFLVEVYNNASRAVEAVLAYKFPEREEVEYVDVGPIEAKSSRTVVVETEFKPVRVEVGAPGTPVHLNKTLYLPPSGADFYVYPKLHFNVAPLANRLAVGAVEPHVVSLKQAYIRGILRLGNSTHVYITVVVENNSTVPATAQVIALGWLNGDLKGMAGKTVQLKPRESRAVDLELVVHGAHDLLQVPQVMLLVSLGAPAG
jgi:hypothetical protein